MNGSIKFSFVAGLRNFFIVPPQEFREVIVGVTLAVVTEEQVKSLAVRVATGTDVTEAPFPDFGC